MTSKGFSLVELVVILAIIGILLSISALNFGSWQRKNNVERYVKELYSDLQEARMKAAYTKKRQGVELGASQVEFREFSSEADVTGTVTSKKQLPFSLTWSTWTTPASNRIEFDTNGVMIDKTSKVICVSTTENAPYDAIVVSAAMTSMGKVTDRANPCGETNVTQK
jgi:type II secretion system protein H